MDLEQVAKHVQKSLSPLPEVDTVMREDPEPSRLSDTHADLFVKRIIVTFRDGNKYRVDIRPA